MPDDPLLTAAEAAKYLKVNPGSLANLRSTGGGPDFIKVGSAVRYRTSAIEAWIAGNTVEGAKGHGNWTRGKVPPGSESSGGV